MGKCSPRLKGSINKLEVICLVLTILLEVCTIIRGNRNV